MKSYSPTSKSESRRKIKMRRRARNWFRIAAIYTDLAAESIWPHDREHYAECANHARGRYNKLRKGQEDD